MGVRCKNCGFENNEENNFCICCAQKLKDVCICWVKKSNYNCGESSCPGYALYAIENRLKKESSKNKKQIINTKMHITIRKDAPLNCSNVREYFRIHTKDLEDVIKSISFRKAATIAHICSKQFRVKIEEIEGTELTVISFYASFDVWTRVVKKTEEWKELNDFLTPFVIKEKECCETQHPENN